MGLPRYFSPVAGPVVRAAEARDNPLPWKTATGCQYLPVCLWVALLYSKWDIFWAFCHESFPYTKCPPTLWRDYFLPLFYALFIYLRREFFLSLKELQMLKFDSCLWVCFPVPVAFLTAACPFSAEGIWERERGRGGWTQKENIYIQKGLKTRFILIYN